MLISTHLPGWGEGISLWMLGSQEQLSPWDLGASAALQQAQAPLWTLHLPVLSLL